MLLPSRQGLPDPSSGRAEVQVDRVVAAPRMAEAQVDRADGGVRRDEDRACGQQAGRTRRQQRAADASGLLPRSRRSAARTGRPGSGRRTHRRASVRCRRTAPRTAARPPAAAESIPSRAELADASQFQVGAPFGAAGIEPGPTVAGQRLEIRVAREVARQPEPETQVVRARSLLVDIDHQHPLAGLVDQVVADMVEVAETEDALEWRRPAWPCPAAGRPACGPGSAPRQG